jgi:hypothetical protein
MIFLALKHTDQSVSCQEFLAKKYWISQVPLGDSRTKMGKTVQLPKHPVLTLIIFAIYNFRA